MALDESQKGDEVFDNDGFSLIMDKQLYKIAKPVQIDSEMVDSKKELFISCAISENFCPMAEDPSSCQSYCVPGFCEL